MSEQQIQGLFSFNDINGDVEFQPNLLSITNFVVDKTNYPIVSLPFPPVIEPKDLIIKKKSLQENPDGKPTRAPNAFIIYRKAYVKATRDQGYSLPMTLISSMASASWDQENVVVKEEYKRIAKETHKLIKEMYPKKSNRRKRKDKWNLVSFQDKSTDNNETNLPENKFKNVQKLTQTSTTTNVPNLLLTPSTPISIASSSSSRSSPNLSDITESSPILQQQSTPILTNNNQEQTSEEYLNDELNNVNLPNSFQEYLNQPINDFSEMYSDLTFDGLFDISTIDGLIERNNPRSSSLDMTLAEAFGIINSENFDLGFDF